MSLGDRYLVAKKITAFKMQIIYILAFTKSPDPGKFPRGFFEFKMGVFQ
jgi:hypothetical protein